MRLVGRIRSSECVFEGDPRSDSNSPHNYLYQGLITSRPGSSYLHAGGSGVLSNNPFCRSQVASLQVHVGRGPRATTSASLCAINPLNGTYPGNIYNGGTAKPTKYQRARKSDSETKTEGLLKPEYLISLGKKFTLTSDWLKPG